MKTQPINSQSFSALYISQNESPYTDTQKEIINDIQNKFSRAEMVKVKEKGYDLFLEQGLTDFDNKISVYAVKNLDFNDDICVKNVRKIPIGDYGKELAFEPIYVHYQIDRFEKQEIKLNNFAKIMSGLLIATFLAAAAALGIKSTKAAANSLQIKHLTEIVK